ncbi:MAG: NAD(P)-dependent oxidoreductase [Armatimonadetes bacterium]|nr:NAD(P)-dependent oxidoreductase [Armatimonadota bacterium]
MRVLLTGAAGNVGRVALKRLQAEGYEVTAFDLKQGEGSADWVTGSLTDYPAVLEAAEGCDAVVHAGAIADDWPGQDEQVMAVNAMGTWHALQAAQRKDIGQVVAFSSVQAMGIMAGDRLPDRFPIDETHPVSPARPYPLSKFFGEEMCRSFAGRHGMAVTCFRPVLIARTDHLNPELHSDWAHKDYWAHVDVEDVAEAVLLALRARHSGYELLILSAADTYSPLPTLDLVGQQYPSVPCRFPADYFDLTPYRALFDNARARQSLGWSPKKRFHY